MTNGFKIKSRPQKAMSGHIPDCAVQGSPEGVFVREGYGISIVEDLYPRYLLSISIFGVVGVQLRVHDASQHGVLGVLDAEYQCCDCHGDADSKAEVDAEQDYSGARRDPNALKIIDTFPSDKGIWGRCILSSSAIALTSKAAAL